MLINGGVVVNEFISKCKTNVLKWVGLQGGMLPQ